MLVQKDQEIKKIKALAGKEEEKSENGENSGIDEGLSDSDDSDDGKKKSGKNGLDNFNSVDNTSRAFIKNILLKYLEYTAKFQEKEAMMMEKVLFTTLRVDEVETKNLKESRVQNYNQSYMAYIWAADESNLIAKQIPVRTQLLPAEKSLQKKNKN